MKLRTHAQTAGVSLTAQQPYNNVVRVALQALAAVLGGTQSLHTNSLDETYALPTEEAVTIALRTQQIIAEESGVAEHHRPARRQLVRRGPHEPPRGRGACAYIRRIDEMGGMVDAIEKGYPQREIAASAYRFQRQLERGERVMVGVNKYAERERRTRTSRCCASTRRCSSTQVDEPAQREGDARRGDACRRASSAVRSGGEPGEASEPDAAHHRGGEGLLHAAGDLRRAARGARDVHRPGRVLGSE